MQCYIILLAIYVYSDTKVSNIIRQNTMVFSQNSLYGLLSYSAPCNSVLKGIITYNNKLTRNAIKVHQNIMHYMNNLQYVGVLEQLFL